MMRETGRLRARLADSEEVVMPDLPMGTPAGKVFCVLRDRRGESQANTLF